MPKYRNKEQFFQTVVVAGKRTHIQPGQVFYSDRNLDLNIYTFLEVVADTTPIVQPVVAKKPVSQPTIDSNKKLENELAALKTTIASLASIVSVEELIKKSKEEILSQTPIVEPTEIEQMVNKVTKLSQDMDTVLRRQEVLKNAIETVSKALKAVEEEVYLNNNVVVVDEEEKKDG